MLQLTVNISGKTTSDVEMALEEVLKKVQEGYTSGGDRNDSGRYYFETKGEEEHVEEE